MNLSRHRLVSTIATALAASIYGCGGDSITLPGQAEPAHIVLVTGNAQAGIAGSALPLPLTVKVTNALDKPVPGQSVEFTVTSGGGGVSPASVETGADGRASVTWTLGASAGAQAVQARVVGVGVPDDLTFDFSATAVAGSGSLIAAVSGDDQSAPVNSSLPDSLVVRVSDGNGNPVSGISITWTVQGGGSISPETVVTDDGGRAAAQRVLGSTAGQQTAQAAGDGLAGSPVAFVQTAVASNPTALTLVSGDAQGAPAGFELAGDLVVKLTDADGNGVGGLAVAWVVGTGGGTANPANSTTDPDGFARTRWTLGTVAGANTMTAVYSGLPPVPFTATGSNDAPTTIAPVSGDNQTAVGGAALPQPLVVKVTDANNNPVPDVSVAWTAVGGGTVSGATSATNGQGLAQITRTLGTTLGECTTTAEVTGLAGSPVTFTSTASVGPAAKIVIVTQPSATAAVGAQFAVQPVVKLQDAGGNDVALSGRQITASILNPPSGASLGGDDAKDTDGSGVATFTDLSITGPVQGLTQNYTIRFRSGGLTEIRADVALTVGAVSGAKSTVAANPTSVDAGITTTITVKARDAGGNVLQGVSVALSATGSNNAFTPSSGSTDANGQMTATYSSTSPGSHTINALIDGNTTVTTPVVVHPPPPDPGQSTVTAVSPITSGGSSTITVTARDAGGTAIQGATVVLRADGSATGVTQPTGTTNASGVATGSYTSTALGPHTITAKIENIDITQTATVTVSAGSVSASQSALTVNDPTITAGDPGTLVTVTAKDADGHPISAATVVLAATNGGNFTTPDPTDLSGVTTATFTSTVAGDHNITATINTVTISANATVTVGAAAAANLTFSTQPPLGVASGTEFTVAVSVTDGFGNPTTATVHLDLSRSDATPVALGGTNDVTSTGGVATFSDLTVSDPSLFPYTLTATSSGTNSPDSNPFLVGL